MTPAGGPALIWCPFPDADSAREAAKSLLDARLIACANIIPAMTSLFIWEGARHEATEAGMLVKTNANLLDSAIARLAELHPYDEPAVIGWRGDGWTPGTASWLETLRA